MPIKKEAVESAVERMRQNKEDAYDRAIICHYIRTKATPEIFVPQVQHALRTPFLLEHSWSNESLLFLYEIVFLVEAAS